MMVRLSHHQASICEQVPCLRVSCEDSYISQKNMRPMLEETESSTVCAWGVWYRQNVILEVPPAEGTGTCPTGGLHGDILTVDYSITLSPRQLFFLPSRIMW